MIDDTKSTIVDQISSVAEFVRRRLAGDYSVDEFGYDPHFADAIWLPLLRPLFDNGDLEPVLQPWWLSFPGPFLYYPGRRLVPAPLRAFIDFVKAHAPK